MCLAPPTSTQNFKDGIHCSVFKVELKVSNYLLRLDGKWSSAKVSNISAAKDVLDQLIVIS